MHGTLHFTGAVVGGSCTLTSYTRGAMYEHCSDDAVPETLSVQSLNSSQGAHVRAVYGSQGMAKGESQYVLVSATGSVITQGLYVITQSLR
ncbi:MULTISPECIES: hypothetical protein [unclassified Pseudomonas]|uniref:hypothetical protein n=1 Tax=unclassified Pseudomonas TaxID=196821 RepID=UPI000F748434|nr:MULTISPECIES: hypothetical protein [unclassified Pseudomonas]